MQKGTQYAYTYTVEFSYPNLKLVHIIWISSFLKTKLDDREDRSVWIWLWKWLTDICVKTRLIEYFLRLVIGLHNHRLILQVLQYYYNLSISEYKYVNCIPPTCIIHHPVFIYFELQIRQFTANFAHSIIFQLTL